MRILSLLLLAITTVSCRSDGPVIPPPPDPFSFSLAVSDSNGAAVSGLRIGAWNQLRSGFETPEGSAAFTIFFDCREPALARLTLEDLDGRVDTTLFDEASIVPGTYMAMGHVVRPYGTRIFRCRFTASALSGDSTLFEASVHAVLWQPDAAVAVLGWTGGDGAFRTADTLSFPNVLSHPRLVRTDNAGPDSLGLIILPDSIAVALTDTSAHRTQITVHRITNGSNVIRVTWNPGDAVAGVPRRRTGTTVLQRITEGLPLEWKLYYPFPNPFN